VTNDCGEEKFMEIVIERLQYITCITNRKSWIKS